MWLFKNMWCVARSWNIHRVGLAIDKMDIDSDMQGVQFRPPPTVSSLKLEIEDLSNRIESLHEMRRMSVESLLSVMFSKRAKLFELRDFHPHANVQDTLYSLDLEIQKVQRARIKHGEHILQIWD